MTRRSRCNSPPWTMRPESQAVESKAPFQGWCGNPSCDPRRGEKFSLHAPIECMARISQQAAWNAAIVASPKAVGAFSSGNT